MELDSSILEQAAALDGAGFLIRSGEAETDYFSRVSALRLAEEELEKEVAQNGKVKFVGVFTLCAEERIPAEVIAEAGEATGAKFGFQIDWMPGFYLSGGELGRFFGGGLASCADDGKAPRSVFVLRSEFKKRKKFLFYRRRELLAHELCHAARAPLQDDLFEEYFAYRTAEGGGLRKLFGAGFNGRFDQWIFLLPAIVLLGAQLVRVFGGYDFPIWPFWVLALGGPGFLLLKAILIGKVASRAAKTLKNNGCFNPLAVLFRLTGSEIVELARKDFQSFDKSRQDELRWQVSKKKFFNSPI